MSDLREHLGEIMQGTVCVMGLGNTDYGDDGFGVRLAAKLRDAGLPNVVDAGTSPERYVGTIASAGYQSVLFLDAVELGALPGSAVLLRGDEIVSRYSQLSTHRFSLGTLAQLVQVDGARAYLLGVQPSSLKPGASLSTEVESALGSLYRMILCLCNLREEALGAPVREELSA